MLYVQSLLMCATDLRFLLQVCESVEVIDDLVECDSFGRVSASGADFHLLVVLRVDADVRFDVDPLKFDDSPSDRLRPNRLLAVDAPL